MKKSLLQLGIIAVMVAVGVVGYSIDKEEMDVPLRVLFENKVGAVVFDHKMHTEERIPDMKCRLCHHLETHLQWHAQQGEVTFLHEVHSVSGGYELECSECHHRDTHYTYPEADQGWVGFDHHLHSTSDKYGLGCEDCHHTWEEGKHGATCQSCHKKGSEANESFEEDEDAVHTTAIAAKCAECHDDKVEDEEGCAFCHKEDPAPLNRLFPSGKRFPPCSVCHGEGSPYDASFSGEEAAHKTAIGARCAECHEDMLEDDEGCANCHKGPDPEKEVDHGCDHCHGKDSPNNKVFEGRTDLVHRAAIGAMCTRCHGDHMETKNCKFCHRSWCKTR
jgi:hypothetical protein